jgi:hypothetical protein
MGNAEWEWKLIDGKLFLFADPDNHDAGAEMLPVSEPGGQLSFLVLLCDTLGL